MSEIDPEYLKHQYLYVPWVEGKNTVSAGKGSASTLRVSTTPASLLSQCRSRTRSTTPNSRSCQS